jgi:hypothetical protein
MLQTNNIKGKDPPKKKKKSIQFKMKIMFMFALTK